MKRIILTVTTDLVFDQRMCRICTTLSDNGYDVVLIGRRKKSSPELTLESYTQKRLTCFFEKGPQFYIEYNIRLFIYLLFKRADIYCGIDLDAVLPPLWKSKLFGKPFVFDAHEYFTGMEEIVDRPQIQRIWKWIERRVFSKLKYGYTVSEGYVDLFKSEYNVELKVVRNATVLKDLLRSETRKTTILYQGAVNVGRGLESLIMAMHKIEAELIICGKGDVYEDLISLADKENLGHKVKFMGFVEPERLVQFTQNAGIGITLFDAKGRSNKYSMANRFFDYMHAGVPQLAMNYPEYKNFNARFEVAKLIDDLEPFTITSSINHLLKDDNYYSRLKENALKAREVFNWQNEAKTLLSVYSQVEEENS
ncbi:MAG: group 1 glycosyl transferase [Crocinitomicaceae bacterium]|nr:group 1 glycosyl transferase [Crocinitomicaceae bacterium]|tara:strand:+ start:3414 stop:4511 length:1098 start_codon:yes stop_codon:yes gene_type:complete